MIQELLYTSHDGRGLRKGGGGGFCTVQSTEGMTPNMTSALEKLSGYKHPFDVHDPRAAANPVNYRHATIQVGVETYHVLSRIADIRREHTGRTNKLAHHVALTKDVLPMGGPAWLISHDGICQDGWDGTVAYLPPRQSSSLPTSEIPLKPCQAWQAAAGDAGWAGHIADHLLRNRLQPVSVIVPQRTDTLALVNEVFSLLPSSARWGTTFSTYFTSLPPGTSCALRFYLDQTKEAEQLRRDHRQVRVDLATELGRPPDSPLVTAARTGKLQHDVHAATIATPPLPQSTPPPPKTGTAEPHAATPTQSVPYVPQSVPAIGQSIPISTAAPAALESASNGLRLAPPAVPNRTRQFDKHEPNEPPIQRSGRSRFVFNSSLIFLATTLLIGAIAGGAFYMGRNWSRPDMTVLETSVPEPSAPPTEVVGGPKSTKDISTSVPEGSPEKANPHEPKKETTNEGDDLDKTAKKVGESQPTADSTGHHSEGETTDTNKESSQDDIDRLNALPAIIPLSELSSGNRTSLVDIEREIAVDVPNEIDLELIGLGTFEGGDTLTFKKVANETPEKWTVRWSQNKSGDGSVAIAFFRLMDNKLLFQWDLDQIEKVYSFQDLFKGLRWCVLKVSLSERHFKFCRLSNPLRPDDKGNERLGMTVVPIPTALPEDEHLSWVVSTSAKKLAKPAFDVVPVQAGDTRWHTAYHLRARKPARKGDEEPAVSFGIKLEKKDGRLVSELHKQIYFPERSGASWVFSKSHSLSYSNLKRLNEQLSDQIAKLDKSIGMLNGKKETLQDREKNPAKYINQTPPLTKEQLKKEIQATNDQLASVTKAKEGVKQALNEIRFLETHKPTFTLRADYGVPGLEPVDILILQ